ncbi:hypothetical protein [Shewanella livingstonensis]|uniref:Uncharacterized protein n=1 Tax=Shewanella livingstonensis TaxID=150120 RepID=A0A3G8LRS3_9GAMM|nr:hypothetical protein [Shewanella livingstonensis]AZG72221.1 hypothetical protein EGC82_05225 [Shewanella livingstonensis]
MPERTDATKNILGIEYQKLISLEYCLDSPPNKTVYIEYYGDVATDNESVEVKHHFGKGNLSSKHIDFWKTLYNLVDDRLAYDAFDSLKLHTTQSIKPDSIFYGWNTLEASEKLSRIKGIESNETISTQHSRIMSESDEILKEILGKLTIDSSQPKVEEKLDSLLSHSGIQFITSAYDKADFIEKMIGYITTKAIRNPNCWEVNINDFRDNNARFLRKYTQGVTAFPVTKIEEVNRGIDQKFLFEKQMHSVGFTVRKIDRAVNNYLRADNSKLKMLSTSVPPETIDNFTSELLDLLLETKESYEDYFESGEFACVKKASRDMYDKCLDIKDLTMDGVSGIHGYYFQGSVHGIVQAEYFCIPIVES